MDEGNARRLSRQQHLKCLNICSRSHARQQLQNGGGKPGFVGKYHEENTMETKSCEGWTIGVSVFDAGTPD